MFRDGFREAKAHWELNLVREVKGKKKDCYACMNSKRKTRKMLVGC